MHEKNHNLLDGLWFLCMQISETNLKLINVQVPEFSAFNKMIKLGVIVSIKHIIMQCKNMCVFKNKCSISYMYLI